MKKKHERRISIIRHLQQPQQKSQAEPSSPSPAPLLLSPLNVLLDQIYDDNIETAITALKRE
jgi:hypothetical protein